MRALFNLAFLTLLVGHSAIAKSRVDYGTIFVDREGCFILHDLQSEERIEAYNPSRCDQRFSPFSTFKIAAAAMAFEKRVFKDENHLVKWDGVKRGREEINQDQTPFSFMSQSVKWVTEWIMPQIGQKAIHSFLDAFKYGNKDFSGGLQEAWVSSSLKISAVEQVDFLSKFWRGNLGLSERTTNLTKKVMLIKKFGEKTELYGKTGTGCLVGHDCMQKPGKMFGWFVGVLKTENRTYVFAGNASDLKPQGPPGGPRMRTSTLEILKQLGMVAE